MYQLHVSEEVTPVSGVNGQPLDLSVYDKLNKARIKLKRGRLRRIHKAKPYIYSQKFSELLKSNQQNSDRLPCSSIKSEIFICPMCHMEATSFNIFAQHMAVHFNQLPETSSNESINTYNFDLPGHLQGIMGGRCSIDTETMNNTSVDSEVINRDKTKLLELIKEYIPDKNSFGKETIGNSDKKTIFCDTNVLSCGICSHPTTFDQFADLLSHLQTEHLLTYYHCEGCEEKFTDRNRCLVHILSYHTDLKNPTGNTELVFRRGANTFNITTKSVEDTDQGKLISHNENESCKHYSLDGEWDTKRRLSEMDSDNTTMKEKGLLQEHNAGICLKNNPYSSKCHLATHDHSKSSNLSSQVVVESNKERCDHHDGSESNVNTSNTNCICRAQSFIHFLSMLFWPSLWSFDLMKMDAEEPLGGQVKTPNASTSRNMEHISKSEDCVLSFPSAPLPPPTRSLSSSSPLSLPSSSLSCLQRKAETEESQNIKGSTTPPSEFKSTKNDTESKSSSELNEPVENLDLENTVPSCIFLLRSHPVLGLLPHEIASKVDSYKASKICHICLKEFTDEMTVLHHQVEQHSLKDVPSMSDSSNDQQKTD
uniref:C2H2-type domain-containing protein n=1 Tax=Trichobilharzia regenti TaxID=157069 RepID=A0AA85J2W5_TRIRE|nr:unnamed protein product [Trichobilharzia regenti]